MKNFASPSFFRVFDLLLSTSNLGLKKPRWSFGGVLWEHDRYTFNGPKHGLAIDIITLTHQGRRGWSLMVAKEYWWVGEESKPLKNLRWARPTAGRREDIIAWLRTQETALERQTAFARPSPADNHEQQLVKATFDSVDGQSDDL